MPSSLPVVIIVVACLSPLAALSAFLISYHEYAQHYEAKREPLRLAAGTALVALLAFVVLGTAAGVLLEWALK